MNCTLANTIVSVTYTDTTRNSFEDYTTTVSTSLDSLVYNRDETRWGYFQPDPMQIRVDLTYLDTDGIVNNKTISGTIPNPVPNKHYEILINASPDQGMASFQIFMDESEIPVEIVELGDNPATPPEGNLAYGDILITEIMPDPSALSDTEGEWFEIYNNSSRIINLQNLVLERDDINSHVISDSIELTPGEYYVMSRSETATDAVNNYIYGTAITLSNTGAVLSIYNEDSETGPGVLIFSVDYGGANFPSTSGASISLNPNFLDAAYAVLGPYWCTSTSSCNTGDLGTPGLGNDLCE